MRATDRVILIVLDSVGAGELPDAGTYGDQGSNTLGNIAKAVPLEIPTLRSLGIDRIVDIGRTPAPESASSGGPGSTAPKPVSSTTGEGGPRGAYGRMA